MTDNERFFKFFDYLKESGKLATQVELAAILGTNKAGINDLKSGKKKVTVEHLKSMKKSYPELNFDWMLLEEGDMITSEGEKHIETNKEFLLKTDSRQELQRVPLYGMEAAASLVKLFDGSPSIVDYISIPNLPKSDGALYVTGDSMYPLLKSGDIAVYKQLHNIPDGIFYGEMYLLDVDIDGDEHTVVKFVQKSEKGPDWISLVSQNVHHAPKDVHLKGVRAMALVKASIRINSMI